MLVLHHDIKRSLSPALANPAVTAIEPLLVFLNIRMAQDPCKDDLVLRTSHRVCKATWLGLGVDTQ